MNRIIIKPTDGLGSRIGVILSAYVLAQLFKKSGVYVRFAVSAGFSDVSWESLFGYPIHNITEDEYQSFRVDGIRLDEMVSQELVTHNIVRNQSFSFWDTRDIIYEGPLQLNWLMEPQEYVNDFLNRDGNQLINKEYYGVRPSIKVMEIIKTVQFPREQTVGVHIRRGDAVDVENKNAFEYLKSNEDYFHNFIVKELLKGSTKFLYLATDDEKILYDFIEKYGSRIICLEKVFVPSLYNQPKDGQFEAAVELFLLSKTKFMMGTNFSRYSSAAAHIGMIPMICPTIDKHSFLMGSNISTKNNFDKKIIIKPSGGIGNRLRVLLSAEVIGEIIGADVLVYWAPCNIFDETYTKLFANPITEINKFEYEVFQHECFEINVDFPCQETILNKDTILYNNCGEIVWHLSDDDQKFMYKNKYVELLNKKYQNLKPSLIVMDLMKHVKITNDMIGIHIRRGEVADPNFEGRHHYLSSSESAFCHAIDYELSQRPERSFFLVTESFYTLQRFMLRYKGKISYLRKPYRKDRENVWTDDFKHERVPYYVADMFLLSKTEKVFGNACSSFGNSAARIGGIPLELMQDKVSVVCGCKNREEQLARSIPNWLSFSEITEILIVDWSSDIPLSESLKHFDDSRIRIIRVEGQDRWIPSKSHNLGCQLSSGNVILRLDGDYRIHKDFFVKHVLDEGIYFLGDWRAARESNENHLAGAILVYKKDFERVNGYNERIITYGWEDDDLFTRIAESGLKPIAIDFDFIYHEVHGDDLRVQHQPVKIENISIEVDKNRGIAAANPWTTSDLRTEFDFSDGVYREKVVKVIEGEAEVIEGEAEAEVKVKVIDAEVKVIEGETLQKTNLKASHLAESMVHYSEYYNDGNLKIVITCDPLEDRIPLLCNDHTYILKLCYWYMNGSWKHHPDYDPEKITICCNSQEELDLQGSRHAIFLNHNMMINWNKFKIENKPRIYDAILIARPLPMKRHWLAKKIGNLALVLGYIWFDTETYDVKKNVPHVYYNSVEEGDPYLDTQDLMNLFNQSCCGLCLSQEEGACFSSSEYLLAGLPVVSTHSKGGRDVWYNEFNHEICEDNADSVKNCVNHFLWSKQTIDRGLIRKTHIEKQFEFYKILVQETDRIFKLNNVRINAQDYFEKELKRRLATSDRRMWDDWQPRKDMLLTANPASTSRKLYS